MARVLTLALLTGILAIPLCSTGSVPDSAPAVRGRMPAAIERRTNPVPISKVQRRQPGRHSKSLPRRSAVRTSREEPAVVILYGSRPWSWM
jgi:hypothetical protein